MYSRELCVERTVREELPSNDAGRGVPLELAPGTSSFGDFVIRRAFGLGKFFDTLLPPALLRVRSRAAAANRPASAPTVTTGRAAFSSTWPPSTGVRSRCDAEDVRRRAQISNRPLPLGVARQARSAAADVPVCLRTNLAVKRLSLNRSQ